MAYEFFEHEKKLVLNDASLEVAEHCTYLLFQFMKDELKRLNQQYVSFEINNTFYDYKDGMKIKFTGRS